MQSDRIVSVKKSIRTDSMAPISDSISDSNNEIDHIGFCNVKKLFSNFKFDCIEFSKVLGPYQRSAMSRSFATHNYS